MLPGMVQEQCRKDSEWVMQTRKRPGRQEKMQAQLWPWAAAAAQPLVWAYHAVRVCSAGVHAGHAGLQRIEEGRKDTWKVLGNYCTSYLAHVVGRALFIGRADAEGVGVHGVAVLDQ